MAEFDTVIKGGTIVDGTRIPRYKGDIAIKDGVIAEIGHIDAGRADKVLDAEGQIVAPGFVDLHTHYDAQLFWDPYCSISCWHGITSVVIGNCGFGFAPVAADARERAMLSMTRVEAIPLASMREGMPWDWESFPEYLDSVDRTPKAMNILPYVPTGPILVTVLGLEDAKAGRLPTDEEHAEMMRLFEEALDAGGCGWSAQRLPPTGPASVQLDYDGTPMPTDVMHNETCIEFAKVLGRRNQGHVQMTFSSGDNAADRKHMEELAEISGRPLVYNVVQAFDDRPHVHRGALKWLEDCRRRGIRVYGQGLTTDAGFAFTFEDWNLFDESAAWREATIGSNAEKLVKLADPERRQALKDNMPFIVLASFDEIVVTGPATPETEQWLDHTVGLIAEKTGKHPVDALLDIVVADELRTELFTMPPNQSLENLQEIMDNPYVLFGVSDGGAHTKFLTAGRYPTEALTKIVRDNKMLSLEDAHWRLSALPAQLAGFTERGVLKKGAPADVVVYDLENLEILPAEVVHDLPGNEWRRVQRAKGYRYILVNGEVTIENDEQTNTYSGRLLRHGDGVQPLRQAAE
ncbi:MAG: amidohydrolase family protein [Rhodospirillales bacterium]|nr:amidohydrolase family protein [Rhodospirillales bacterium]